MNQISVVNGDGYLAKILFDVAGSGSSSLALSNVIFSDQTAAKTFPTNFVSPPLYSVPTVVTTNNASNIAETTATLNGTLLTISTGQTANLSFGYATQHG